MLKYIRTVMSAKKDEGASAVEYGLMVAAIAAIIVGVVFALGGVVKNIFSNNCTAIQNNPAAAAGPAGQVNCNP